MDHHRFDQIARSLATFQSRRGLLGALGLGAVLLPGITNAKKKKKKKCKNGAVKCGKACIDTQTNAQHCGGCGQPCAAGQSCANGRCQGGGGCGSDRQLCGAECVNLANDEAHCGQCDRACSGDLTCINGNCACAAGTTCGADCVNTQTDSRHCGGCGNACGSGASCAGGQCVAPPECSSDFDCGAGTGDLTCRNGRCVCKKDGEGICYRYPGAAGLAGECNPCCTGGDGQCLRDHVCRNGLASFNGVPYPICHCPADTVTCNFGESFRCTSSIATDHRRCGLDCVNCLDAFGYCWAGTCDRGCNLGSFCDQSATRPCGSNGFPCNSDSICCNMGPGTFPRCIPNSQGGVCYLNGV